MCLPNFLILGAPRAGTTSLYNWLSQHPAVFMSELKEPHFFAVDEGDVEHNAWIETCIVRTRLDYERLFDGAGSAKAVGEASTTYLESEGAPGRIARALGKDCVRLIALLRNPVDRAFSHFCDHRSDRAEPICRFSEAWKASGARAKAEKRIDWDYIEPGFYARHIERYLQWFPRESILPLLFDDLTSNPGKVMAQICGHLGISGDFEFDTSVRHNSSSLIAGGGIPALAGRRFNTVQRMLPPALRTGVVASVKAVVMQRPVLSSTDRAELLEVYRTDILRLETLLDRSLGHWLNSAR